MGSATPQTTLWGCPGPRIEPGMGDLEARTLTTRPPHLLTYTNGARCVDRREIGEARAVSMRAEHSYKRSLHVLWRHEGGNSGPTLGGKGAQGERDTTKLPRSSQASEGCRRWLQQISVFRFSINLVITLWRLIGVDNTFGALPQRTRTWT